MGTLDRTWKLFKQSFAVLGADTEILLFPVLSTIAAILVGASFFVPLYELGIFESIRRGTAEWTDYIPLFSWYYANYFVVIFFNSALVGCANIRLSGGNPTLGDGFRIAMSRVHRIAAWTLVAATVGLILRSVEERSRWVGRLVISLLGLGWTLITYLIVPVIIFEDRSISDSIRRSAELFRSHWGEQVAGNFGFGLLGLLLVLPGVLLGVLAYSVDHVAGILLGLVYVLILATVFAAVKGIFTVALYRYATDGHPPFGFSRDLIDGAFRWRKHWQ